MRLLSLDLRDYGPFRNAPPLDLADSGLHLIVGPNEAGKSSALRAIRALLFDFPHSTPDDHGRAPASLRVGAQLRGEDGAEVAFVRRKRAPYFFAPDDRTPLPSDPLPGVLDGLDARTFEDLFSTDHAELARGGRAILEHGGKLGEMLFAAGSGLRQLESARVAIQGQLDELFKGRNARLPAINKGIEELKAARELVRGEALPTADWVATQAELTRAQTRRAEVARRRAEVQADLDRRRGWLGALRVIPRRRDALDRLAARGNAPDLRPDFAEAYRQEAEAARQARRSGFDARAALDGVEAQLADLGPPDPILREADAIRRLHADLGRYAEGRVDRPDRAARLDRLAERAADLRSGLPDGASIPPGGLAALRDPIQALAVEQARLLDRRREVEAELDRLVDPQPEKADRDDSGPTAAEAVDHAEALQAALDRAVAAGDLEARRREVGARRSAGAAALAESLRGLALWSGTLDALLSLAIPPEATFDRAEGLLRAAEERLRVAEGERLDLRKRRLELDREAERAALGGPSPTEADLRLGRGERDALWAAIRAEAEAGTPFNPRQGDRLEEATRLADDLADRLRREADRVAADAQRAIDRRDLDDRLRLAVEARDAAEGDRLRALEEWAGHWRPLGIEPLSPREMRDWVRVDRPERLRLARDLRDLDAELARLDGAIAALRFDLDRPLARLGAAPADGDESLAATLDRARAALDRHGSRVRAEFARARLRELDREQRSWLDRWAVALGPIGLDASANPAAAHAVLDRLVAWHDAAREADAARAGLLDLDAFARRFADDAAGLARLLGESTGAALTLSAEATESTDWGPVARALADRLDRARATEARRATLRARADDERAQRDEAERALLRADEALAALAREAGSSDVAGLPDAIRRAKAVAEDRAEVRRLDEQLDALAGTQTRAELLEAVAGRDEASLAAEVAELAEALPALDAELAGLSESIGRAVERARAMAARAGAYQPQEELAILAARLEGNVERYARLRLASAVLREAIERYRVQNQAPVLDRAGVLFARLTAGSFVGLQPDRDDKGQPILLGVRAPKPDDPPSSEPILLDVAAMSAGTADQLYLALRLASLSVHLDDHPPAPFVVDDILIQADDERARAALAALAELSTRTQVLFFTHHDHLIPLARSAVPEGALTIHRLDPRAVAETLPNKVPAPAHFRGESGPAQRRVGSV